MIPRCFYDLGGNLPFEFLVAWRCGGKTKEKNIPLKFAWRFANMLTSACMICIYVTDDSPKFSNEFLVSSITLCLAQTNTLVN